jgi:hypothetical protein
MCAKTSKVTKTNNSWAALLQSEIVKKCKMPKGDGWRTAAELKAEWDIGFTRVYNILSKQIKEGKVERFDGNIINNDRLASRTWYRIK